MTLSPLAYAGIPYQVPRREGGALALMMACSRSPMLRDGSCMAAIAASTALSPSAPSAPGVVCVAAVLCSSLSHFALSFHFAIMPAFS